MTPEDKAWWRQHLTRCSRNDLAKWKAWLAEKTREQEKINDQQH